MNHFVLIGDSQTMCKLMKYLQNRNRGLKKRMQIMIWVLHFRSLHLKNQESLISYQSGKYSVGCHVARISSGITSEIDVSTMLLTIIYLSNKMRVGLRPKICLNSLQLKQVTNIQPFFFINLQTQSWIFSFGQIIDLTRLKFQFS